MSYGYARSGMTLVPNLLSTEITPAKARVNATQNSVADEVWKAYSNLEPRLVSGKLRLLYSRRRINRMPLRWNPTTMVSAIYWM